MDRCRKKKEIFPKIMVNVLPSYNEGLPMTILETMALGIPNISTNIASIPEIIIDGETGYLVNPGDKAKIEKYLISLINDDEMRKRISENSWKLIRNTFSLEHSISLLIQEYDRVLEKGR